MDTVYFKPWVGSQFSRENPKLLILGESHYADRKPSPRFTIELTREYANGEWNHRFWTQIMQAVSGKAHWEVDRKEFWERYAFYNYIQSVVADSAGVGPTQEMIQEARIPFFQVLDNLRPDHILVLSKRLWDALPSDGQQGNPLRIGEEERETWIYPFSGGQAIASWLPHPSYGFSAPQWHPWIKELQSQ